MEEHHEQLEGSSTNMKINHDLNSQNKVLPPLYSGPHVRILNRPNNTWHPRTLVQKDENLRSYAVETPNRVRFRRKRTYLRDVPTPLCRSSTTRQTNYQWDKQHWGQNYQNQHDKTHTQKEITTSRSGRIAQTSSRYETFDTAEIRQIL